MKKIVLSLTLALSLAGPYVPAYAVYCENCGNEVTQYANYTQLVNQSNNLINQLEVLRAQAAKLKNGLPSSLNTTLLANIMSTVNKGQALGYNLANISKKFETDYPAFGKENGSYYDKYSKWSATTSDSIRSALMASGLQMENFETESATAETLRTMNDSATGQMQAIQVGNAVSSEMLDEMRKLRELNTAQMQAQNAYLLADKQKQDNSESSMQSFLKQKKSTVKTYDEFLKDRK